MRKEGNKSPFGGFKRLLGYSRMSISQQMVAEVPSPNYLFTVAMSPDVSQTSVNGAASSSIHALLCIHNACVALSPFTA